MCAESSWGKNQKTNILETELSVQTPNEPYAMIGTQPYSANAIMNKSLQEAKPSEVQCALSRNFFCFLVVIDTDQ